MTEQISFNQLADFVRDWAHLGPATAITPDTQFEHDLGITGDDGCELLDAVEKHFDVLLHSDEDGYRKTFNLDPDEYLFHSEGGFMLPLYDSHRLISIFNSEPFGMENVRAFTIGELYCAIQKQVCSS